MIETLNLDKNFEISRIIKGGWQLSEGHSNGVSNNPISDMNTFADAGIVTFDCADIYTGVEEIIGKFLKQYNKPEKIKVLTKFVPDFDRLPKITKSYVTNIIDRSLMRLGLERLNMVQFAWWTYDVPGWVETASWLKELQQEGKIELLSVTNFNTSTTQEIIDAGIPLSTCQVQYSLLDRRPEKSLVELCRNEDMYLLCYGVLAGGFLSERWLDEKEPEGTMENRSLTKYKLIIEELGGWDFFQELLSLLKHIGDKHGVSIPSVATKHVLDRDRVAAAIIGARNANHIQDHFEVFQFNLDEDDRSAIQDLLSQANEIPLDVFDVERDKDGPHGRIMKYNLNQ